MENNNYPWELCKYCSFTSYGTEDIYDGIPGHQCYDRWCKEAADEYYKGEHKEWIW